MNSKVKVGLIGAGNICLNSHVPAYRKMNDVELLAVCDYNLSHAEQVKEQYGMKYAVRTLEELLAIEEVDAVGISTWNSAHAQAVIQAAQAGKHIFCEKPMALTVEECIAMQEAVEKAGVIFMVGFVNRFMSESVLLKQLVVNGSLGNVYHARTSWLRRRGTPRGWFTDVSKSGGGPVIDIGVHIIDLAWYLMGCPTPTHVSAMTYSEIGDYQTKGVSRWAAREPGIAPVFNTEDSATGLIRFDNGSTINFDVSWAMNVQEEAMAVSLFGNKAGARLSPLTIYGEMEQYLSESLLRVADNDKYYDELRHFIDCVQTGSEPISNAHHGLMVQRMLNGIYASAEAGREVEL